MVNNPKVKIFFLIPSLVGGGAEKVLINLLNRFDFNNYDVDLCVVVDVGVYFKDIPKQVRLFTLFNNDIISRILNKIHVKFNINYLYRSLVRKKISKSYDVGISFIDSSYTDILFFVDEKIKHKISWIHSSYNTNVNYLKFYSRKYKSRILEHRYRKLDTIIFVSNAARLEFEEIFGKFSNTKVIYNLLGYEEIIEKSKEILHERINKEIVNIITLGRLDYIKAFDKLINVSARLKKDKLKFKIRILGSGALKKELNRLIKKLNVGDVVELVSFKSNPYPLLKSSDIFIMTSLSEALPVALCEALIIGLPSVVTNSSGCNEIIGNGEYGVLTSHDMEDIYTKLKDLILDKNKREFYAVKSRERAKIFNDSKILAEVYQTINSINENSSN